MRPKELKVVNIFLVLIVVFFVALTINLSSNGGPRSIISSLSGIFKKKDTTLVKQQEPCTSKKKLSISANTDPNLEKLIQYQNMCQSYVTNSLMFFTSFPDNADSANELATSISAKLINFNKSGVSPIVIVEPYIDGGAMSYRDYLNGKYDSATDEFFKRLRDLGVNDKMMGTWVPFPESNTPAWNNKDTEPKDFADAVNRYLSVTRKYFPNSKGSVLLSATTYEPTDTQYENGNYLSLVPYLQNLDKNLVTSIGIQGFPWVSRASAPRREIFRASEFLQPDYAVEAAQELRTRDIWFNTGSFAAKYTNQKNDYTAISLGDRKAILSGVIEEVRRIQQIQQNEYRVSINLFAEDKSRLDEATDWSYFQNDDSQKLLKEFLNETSKADINVSLYDK